MAVKVGLVKVKRVKVASCLRYFLVVCAEMFGFAN